MVEIELAAALSVSADFNFVREVGIKSSSFLTARRWARLEYREQRRRSAIDFLALARHTARG